MYAYAAANLPRRWYTGAEHTKQILDKLHKKKGNYLPVFSCVNRQIIIP